MAASAGSAALRRHTLPIFSLMILTGLVVSFILI